MIKSKGPFEARFRNMATLNTLEESVNTRVESVCGDWDVFAESGPAYKIL
ncbi:MAG TPA: hypothetical protein PLL64_13290 [Rhodothermales bacterium]|nr:hypothetical protein [Rhodothermales bacterium]HRR09156.1 hypothetical protein [Rhodothermales bacterium]